MKRFSTRCEIKEDVQEQHPDRASGAASLLLPIALSLLAFAANSIFCRLALMGGDIDPDSFTAIRLSSGAVFLLMLLRSTGTSLTVGGSWKGGLCLFLYAYLFSIAYLELGAGAGALVLFGAVQVTMFLFSWAKGERVSVRVVLGMLIAFAGLVTLLLPGANAPALGGVTLMLMSGVAWGAYSLIGKGSTHPVADTAGNFFRSLPCVACLVLVSGFSGPWHLNTAGVLYALGAGVLASGAGYAVWYGVVKRLPAHNAATLQLSVPVIAALGGVLFLGEPISLRFGMTAAVVLGGVALAIVPGRRPRQG